MSLSLVIRQTEEVLQEILQNIRKEYEGPFPVLSETDRSRFVEEEKSLRVQLEEVQESELMCSSWKRLLLLRPSPAAATQCLKDAQELRQRVRRDISTKLETRLTGGSLPPSSSYGQSPARTPVRDAGFPVPEGLSEPASGIITSPLNMGCSLSELQLSDVNVNPAAQHDRLYSSEINEAINSPLEAASESIVGDGNSPTRPRRRAPPPPPIIRVAPPNDSRPLLDASSDSGSDSTRPSHPVRRPPPPPPQSPGQSRSLRSPTRHSFSTMGSLPDPDMVSQLTNFALEMGTLASSMAPGVYRHTSQGRQQPRSSHYVTKTNCLDITGSNVDAITVNNGGTKNSGAVIHKIPSPRAQRVSPV